MSRESAQLNKDKKLWERKFVVSNYDDDALQKLKYQHIVTKTISEIMSSDIIVEVGCGTGLISFEAAKNAKEVLATDISSEMIEQCKSKQVSTNVNNITFSKEDSYSLSFEDSTADKLICCNALHVMDDPSKALGEMKRVLKSDGLLIIPTYCHKEGKSISSRLFRTAIRFASFIGVIPSLHIWSKEDLINVIESAGFRIKDSERIDNAKMFCLYVSAIKQ